MEQSVPKVEREIGIETYATSRDGIGGVIRHDVEDFMVQEVLVDGSKATIEKTDTKPLGATAEKQRFLLCVLVKRNWDTFIAIKQIAKQLGVNEARVQIAGIKDAKAVTAQHITIGGISAQDTVGILIKDIELRSLGYLREQLSPFYLLGNNFKININEIPCPSDAVAAEIRKVIAELVELGGIPNFYGHQRFGTTRPITHIIGKSLVQGKIEDAVMDFLAKPSAHEHPESMQARLQLQASRDFKQAFRDFPVQLRFERLMLACLSEKHEDFVGAFRRLPLRLRLLFLQAYQSFLFNRFLSQRIKQGISLSKAEEGDFVVNVERNSLPLAKTGKIVDGTKLAETNRQIKEGKLRIALPLLGYGQRLSQGLTGEMQHRILEEEGIDPRGFRIDALPELSSKGELRAAVSPVRDFSLRFLNNAPGDDLSRAQLEFTLLRSSYATVLLREIMKPKDLIKAGF